MMALLNGLVANQTLWNTYAAGLAIKGAMWTLGWRHRLLGMTVIELVRQLNSNARRVHPGDNARKRSAHDCNVVFGAGQLTLILTEGERFEIDARCGPDLHQLFESWPASRTRPSMRWISV